MTNESPSSELSDKSLRLLQTEPGPVTNILLPPLPVANVSSLTTPPLAIVIELPACPITPPSVIVPLLFHLEPLPLTKIALKSPATVQLLSYTTPPVVIVRELYWLVLL